ncbi:MAG: 2-dehydropantoate 2-reductase, partial [Pseudomonadota bacterium]
GDLDLPSVSASENPADADTCDVVVFTVKMQDADAAAQAIRPIVGPDTVVVPYLNGVEASDILVRQLGERPVAGGSVYVSAVIDRPGVIRQTGTIQRFVHGEIDGRLSNRMQAWHEALENVGIESILTEDIRREVWRKFVALVSFSGLTALTRKPIGNVREHKHVNAMLIAAVNEAAAVARAHDAGLPDDIVDLHLALIGSMPWEMKSSMQEDLERGKPLELPWLSGAVVRLGEAHGIDTPTHRFIATALALHQDGR